MKLKKGILLITILFLSMLVLSPLAKVQAAEGSLYLDIKMLRNSGYGYQLADGTKNVWKIYEVGKTADDTIYCLKGGPGFGSSNFSGSYVAGTETKTLYTRYFDLKDPASIPDSYKVALPDVNSTNYKALIWILDNCYVLPKQGASDEAKAIAAQNRQMLLEAAKNYALDSGNPDIEGYHFDYLTDDDIDAVQQLAVWHYTNQAGDGYHIDNTFTFWLNAVAGTDGNYMALTNRPRFGDEGWYRMYACQALFEYLTKTPKQAGFDYDITSTVIQKPTLANTELTAKTVNGRTIIGPYQIQGSNSDNYSLQGIVKDAKGNTITDFTYVDQNGNSIQNVTTLKDLIGKNFYISIPANSNSSTITFEISGSYFTTTTTYWSVESPNPAKDQPVVKVEKKNVPFNDSKVYKEFDLVLRKFIISIDGEQPQNREPQISSTEITNLANGTTTTAEKVHSKTPLPVKTGSKVIYKIRVYNEGAISGYATQVTDYLPEGLSFLPESDINKEYGWSNPSNDGKTIVTNYLENKSIDAFNGNNIDFEDLQIECEVTASSQQSVSLKNIAEITAHKDENGKTTVIDRDSIPGNVDLNNYQETSQQDDDDFEHLILEGKSFDLVLRKFIISIDGEAPKVDRTPQISNEEIGKLANKTTTTANKVHSKTALPVKTGSKVIYKIRVYNEGDLAGFATQVTDYLPEGLAFLPNSSINQEYGWSNPSNDGKTIVTNYLADKKLAGFTGTTIEFEDLQIECEVTAVVQDKDISLKNIAEITAHKDENGNTTVIDRDSQPGNVNLNNYGETSQQDDDDFEHLVIVGKYFDLSLRKFITSVQNGNDTKTYNRAPQVVTTELASGASTTATYNHPKTPIGVSNGNIVTYTIRVYNEGQLDGYVTEITDHLPEQLEFIVDDETNIKYGWTVSTDGKTVKTTITSPKTTYSANRDEIYKDRVAGEDKVLLKAFDGTNLDYIDVQIKCKVKENINLYQKITNIADITGFTDTNGNPIKDRDSQENNVKLPTNEELPNYKDEFIDRGDNYIEGQQDDDDFEKLVLQIFDLSLRKFITGVNDKEITSRAPVFNKNGTQYTYEHTKEPVEVANGNTVIYTLRIFNEGNVAGYAQEIKDNLPEGLIFLPEHEINVANRWKMYKEDGTETTKVEEAVTIRTDYLSKEQEKEAGQKLITAFNPETMTMPDYKDIKVAFKVTEPNTSDRIIINTAEISEDANEEGKPVDDIDSTPDNNIEGEDDIDIEKIKVKYFDLSLKKWVTESIVTYNGKTTVTKTGHTGDENPEAPAKVELKEKELAKTTVKFKFNIKVTNEGEIAGYATELIDYIPEGLKYNQKDNPKWREENGKVLTNQLKDTLLQPGESATVEIVLTWVNNKNNLSLKTNWAEIYKDKNEYDSPDIDSTPGNNVKGEDDIDQAPVILTVATGIAPTYIILTLASVMIVASGVVLIRKFVI